MDRSFGDNLANSASWNPSSSRVEHDAVKQLAILGQQSVVPLASSAAFLRIDKENAGRRISEMFSPSVADSAVSFGLAAGHTYQSNASNLSDSFQSGSTPEPMQTSRYNFRKPSRQTASPSDIAALAARLASEDGDIGAESPVSFNTPGANASNVSEEDRSRSSIGSVDLHTTLQMLLEPDATAVSTELTASMLDNDASNGLGVTQMLSSGGTYTPPSVSNDASVPTPMPATSLSVSLGPAHRVKTPGRSILSSSFVAKKEKETDTALALKRKQHVIFGSPQAAEFHGEAPASTLTAMDKSLVRTHFKLGGAELPFPSLEEVQPVISAAKEDDTASIESVETSKNSIILSQFEDELADMESSVAQKRRAREQRRASKVHENNKPLSGSKRRSISSLADIAAAEFEVADAASSPAEPKKPRTEQVDAELTEYHALDAAHGAFMEDIHMSTASELPMTDMHVEDAASAEAPQSTKPPLTPTSHKHSRNRRTDASPSALVQPMAASPRRSPRRAAPPQEEPSYSSAPAASISFSPQPQARGLIARGGIAAKPERRRATLAVARSSNAEIAAPPAVNRAPTRKAAPKILSPASISASSVGDRTANTADVNALFNAFDEDDASIHSQSLNDMDESAQENVGEIPSVLSVSMGSQGGDVSAIEAFDTIDDATVPLAPTMRGFMLNNAIKECEDTIDDVTVALPPSMRGAINVSEAHDAALIPGVDMTVNLPQRMQDFLNVSNCDNSEQSSQPDVTVPLAPTLRAMMVSSSTPQSGVNLNVSEASAASGADRTVPLPAHLRDFVHLSENAYDSDDVPIAQEDMGSVASRVADASGEEMEESAFQQSPGSVRFMESARFDAVLGIDGDDPLSRVPKVRFAAMDLDPIRLADAATQNEEAALLASYGITPKSTSKRLAADVCLLDAADVAGGAVGISAPSQSVQPLLLLPKEVEANISTDQLVSAASTIGPAAQGCSAPPAAKGVKPTAAITQALSNNTRAIAQQTPTRALLEAAIARSARKAYTPHSTVSGAVARVLAANPPSMQFESFCALAGLRFISDCPPELEDSEVQQMDSVGRMPSQVGRKSIKLRRQSSVEAFARKVATNTIDSSVTTLLNESCLLPEKRSLEWANMALQGTIAGQLPIVEHEVAALTGQHSADALSEQPFIFAAVWRANEFIRTRALSESDQGIDDQILADAELLLSRTDLLKQTHEMEARTNWLHWRKTILQKLRKDLQIHVADLTQAVAQTQSIASKMKGVSPIVASAAATLREQWMKRQALVGMLPELNASIAICAQTAADMATVQQTHGARQAQLQELDTTREVLLLAIAAEQEAIDKERATSTAAVQAEKNRKRLGENDSTLSSAVVRAQSALGSYRALVSECGWEVGAVSSTKDISTVMLVTASEATQESVQVAIEIDLNGAVVALSFIHPADLSSRGACDQLSFAQLISKQAATVASSQPCTVAMQLSIIQHSFQQASRFSKVATALKKRYPVHVSEIDSKVYLHYDWSSAVQRQKFRGSLEVSQYIQYGACSKEPAFSVEWIVGEDARLSAEITEAVKVAICSEHVQDIAAIVNQTIMAIETTLVSNAASAAAIC